MPTAFALPTATYGTVRQFLPGSAYTPRAMTGLRYSFARYTAHLMPAVGSRLAAGLSEATVRRFECVRINSIMRLIAQSTHRWRPNYRTLLQAFRRDDTNGQGLTKQ
jgi:hypothetical protein